MPNIYYGVVTRAFNTPKTVAVTVPRVFESRKLLKQIHRSKNMLVHDEGETSKIGDIVTIKHGKPFSKRKHFALNSLEHRPEYPGLPESTVFEGLANKNLTVLKEAQRAKAARLRDEAVKKAIEDRKMMERSAL